MNRLIVGIALMVCVASTPVATAVIYRCAGPEGPIFSDTECGPEATEVELEETTGVGGVYADAIAELATKKAQREEERTAAESLRKNPAIINNQFNTINTEPYGYWPSGSFWRPVQRPPPRPELYPRQPPTTLGKPRR
jgi:hypothetical protein